MREKCVKNVHEKWVYVKLVLYCLGKGMTSPKKGV